MAKSIIFLADGMADEPLAELGNKTPLEAVDTPAMDSIAKRGINGTFLTLPPGLPTSSDVANMSVLGFCPEKNYPGRGPIEAASQNIELADTDIAWRCNLVTVKDGILLDYSAHHIDNEVSGKLMAELQQKLGSDKVTFYPGVSYRNLMVLHGAEFSAAVDYFKPDSSQGIAVSELPWVALDDSCEARHTVDFLNDLYVKSEMVLKESTFNQQHGSHATNIWPWSPGHKPALPQFSEHYKSKRGAIISAVDVIKGLGKCAGMTVIDVPGATGFIDTNYQGKVEAALQALKTHDFVYLHLEAIDECSHMGDLALKMRAIKEFDERIVAPVLSATKDMDMIYAVLPDHPVPIKLQKHTTTPVPVAICGYHIEPDNIESFSETLAPHGALGFKKGDELMRILLEL